MITYDYGADGPLHQLYYDSWVNPGSFWKDYDALPAVDQGYADWVLQLDALAGCWSPPSREDNPPPPAWNGAVIVPPSLPSLPAAVPEAPTGLMMMIGLVVLAAGGFGGASAGGRRKRVARA